MLGWARETRAKWSVLEAFLFSKTSCPSHHIAIPGHTLSNRIFHFVFLIRHSRSFPVPFARTRPHVVHPLNDLERGQEQLKEKDAGKKQNRLEKERNFRVKGVVCSKKAVVVVSEKRSHNFLGSDISLRLNDWSCARKPKCNRPCTNHACHRIPPPPPIVNETFRPGPCSPRPSQREPQQARSWTLGRPQRQAQWRSPPRMRSRGSGSVRIGFGTGMLRFEAREGHD
jgi:hypothetical protein